MTSASDVCGGACVHMHTSTHESGLDPMWISGNLISGFQEMNVDFEVDYKDQQQAFEEGATCLSENLNEKKEVDIKHLGEEYDTKISQRKIYCPRDWPSSKARRVYCNRSPKQCWECIPYLCIYFGRSCKNGKCRTHCCQRLHAVKASAMVFTIHNADQLIYIKDLVAGNIHFEI